MQATPTKQPSQEKPGSATSGWPMLFFNLALLLGGIALIIYSVSHKDAPLVFIGIAMVPVAFILLTGHFALQPNEARVMILFGEYHGTVRESGFYWANPFYSKNRGGAMAQMQAAQLAAAEAAKAGAAASASGGLHSRYGTKISLRAQTLNGDKLKVNDKGGNPIEIAAIVIWSVEDTARAVFDVEDYTSYVRTQTESALRHLASLYAYDHGEQHEPTLRSSVDEVSEALKKELQQRLIKAGVDVEEARLTHLAYAPEIAQAMLRRQQAEAIIAARQKIVHGAVSMVQMALQELDEKHVVNLDEERKAAMVSNLLVVLCGEAEVSPIVNVGAS
jgi:regulator of protease activity HflC (stomatin/prohibitin superfamily)